MFSMRAIIFLLFITIINATSFRNEFKDVQFPEELPANLQDYLLADNPKLSDQCNEQFDQLKRDLQLKKPWALKMVDAGSKIPIGIFSGNEGDLGNFDQCLNVEHGAWSSVPPITGKYCMGTTSYLSLTLATCLPAACSADDMQAIYRNTIKFSESACQTKESQPSLDAVAIATIAFLGVIAAIMLISTIYDVFNYYSKRKPRHSLLVAFSIFTNGNKLLVINNSPGQISCLHGIRTISMMWIILGHRFKTLMETKILNGLDASQWPYKFINSYMTGASVSVDSFLLMSGLVLSYSVMNSMKKGLKFNVFMFYLHRYLRLTPAYAVVVLINVSLMKHLSSGPQWPQLVAKVLENNCKKYWWSALLYVQNYVNPQEPCMGQTWYLSVDTQLFLISPLLLIPFLKWPKLKFYILPPLAFIAALATFLICWFNEIYAASPILDPIKWPEYVNKVYYPTHARASPWIVGLTTGYIIHATKNKNFVRMFGVQHHFMSAILWIGSMSILCACVYGSYFIFNSEFSLAAQTIYSAFTPFGWSIGLSCLILLCVHGYGGPVNWILSNPLMQVVSKFTYSMYLLHKLTMSIYIYSARTTVTFSNFEVWHSFWGDFLFTFSLAVVWVLAFESPVITIEKVLFGHSKGKEPLPKPDVAPVEPTKQP